MNIRRIDINKDKRSENTKKITRAGQIESILKDSLCDRCSGIKGQGRNLCGDYCDGHKTGISFDIEL